MSSAAGTIAVIEGVAMKANYIGNRSDYNKLAYQVAKEEIERQKTTVCPDCQKNIGDQVLSVVCRTLSIRYGFGKQRLQQIVDDTQALFDLCAIDGKQYQATQCVMWLKSIGIDLNGE